MKRDVGDRMRKLLVPILLVFLLIGLFSFLVPRAKATTTYFFDNFESGGYGNWTDYLHWGTSDRSIVYEAGRGNTLRMNGTDWSSGCYMGSLNKVTGSPSYVHMSFLLKYVAVVTGFSGLHSSGGLAANDYSGAYAGFGHISSNNFTACWQNDASNYTGVSATFTLGTWYTLDVYVDLTTNITDYAVNGVYQYSKTYPVVVGYVNSPAIYWNSNGNSGSGAWDVRFDNILVDDQVSPFKKYYYSAPCTSSPVAVFPDITVNGSNYGLPYTLNVTGGNTYVINVTSSKMVSGTYYMFNTWLINGSVYNGANPVTYVLGGNTTFVAYYMPYYPVAPSSGGTYYFRSDTHTVNNVTANILATTNTVSPTVTTQTDITSGLSATWSFRVYLLHIGGTLTELTSDYSTISITRLVDGSSYLNTTWSCPYAPMVMGFDSIEVKAYVKIGAGAWNLKATFTTDRIVKKALTASTWLFNVYVVKTTASTVANFDFGDSASANSYLTGVNFQDMNSFDSILYNFNIGNFFTALLLPYTYLVGGLFYGLLLLLIIVPAYIKYATVDIVLFMMIIFGGAGGFISLLMPTAGLQVGFFIMAFSLGALIYRVFR
jgi:hypothetical protein